MSIVTLNDRAVRSVSTFGSVGTGSMVFIKKLTASDTSTLSFVNGSSDVVLDSTYKEYMFIFSNIHPATDQAKFQVNFRDGGSDYDATKTTTFFNAYHAESDSGTPNVNIETGHDLAQSTSFQDLSREVGNGNDESVSGILQLFNPASTTFVKHFISRSSFYFASDYAIQRLNGGYFNTTSAIDAIRFQFSSGNFDQGIIKLYGIKDS